MKFSPRLSRRLIAGIGLASTAILLPATALAATATAVGPARPATIGSCSAANTRVWLGTPGDGTAGTFYYQLEISNIGTHACTFYGYPGVSALDSHGHQVGLAATHAGARQLVTVAAAATAHVLLGVNDPGVYCGNPLHAVVLRVYAPGQSQAELVPFSWGFCAGKAGLHVDAVHPGTGIPGYSNA